MIRHCKYLERGGSNSFINSYSVSSEPFLESPIPYFSPPCDIFDIPFLPIYNLSKLYMRSIFCYYYSIDANVKCHFKVRLLCSYRLNSISKLDLQVLLVDLLNRCLYLYLFIIVVF